MSERDELIDAAAKAEQTKRRKAAAWPAGIISQAIEEKFYGNITLHFEKGIVVRITQEQTLKPPSL